MTNFTTLLRGSIATAIMFTAVVSTGVTAGAADMDSHAAAALPSSSTNVGAAQAEALAPSARPEVRMVCSFTAPCTGGSSSDGRFLDYGGPGLYFDRISDE